MGIKVFFDGACEPTNPEGIATYGFVVFKDDKKIGEAMGLATEPFSFESSNNVAEYTAMKKALEFLIEQNLNNEEVIVYGDSQLAIRQMVGMYRVKSPRISRIFKECKELEKQFKHISFIWIPRERNEIADELSHRAYTKYLEEHPDVLKEKVEPTMATEKQKAFMDKLKIEYDPFISKREASRLIDRKLNGGSE